VHTYFSHRFRLTRSLFGCRLAALILRVQADGTSLLCYSRHNKGTFRYAPVSSHNLSLSTLIKCHIHTHSPSIYCVRLLISKTFSSIGVDTESRRGSMRWPRLSRNLRMSKVHGMLQGSSRVQEELWTRDCSKCQSFLPVICDTCSLLDKLI